FRSIQQEDKICVSNIRIAHKACVRYALSTWHQKACKDCFERHVNPSSLGIETMFAVRFCCLHPIDLMTGFHAFDLN
ncbi:hypothetical protein FOCC_FOCC014589, partial [Frankliniella occidentalis]